VSSLVCPVVFIFTATSNTDTRADIDAIATPQGTGVDEYGRVVLRYESERALRRLYQARNSIQITIAKTFIEEALFRKILMPTLAAEPPSPPNNFAFLSLLRSALSIVCNDGAEPFTILHTPQR
jgi:hypothetical protein